MIRFVIRRKINDGYSVGYETIETIECDVPELEDILSGGGSGPSGHDYRELIGAEVVWKAKEPK